MSEQGDDPKLVILCYPRTDRVITATFSPDGSLLATLDWDGTVFVWDAATGAPRLRWECGMEWSFKHPAPATLAFTPDGSSLVVAGAGTRVLRLSDGDLERGLPGFKGPVVITADGLTLIGHDRERFLFVDRDAGTPFREIPFGECLESESASIAISADGSTGAVGDFPSRRSEIRIWNLHSGEHIRTLRLSLYALGTHPLPGHGGSRLELSPDGRYLVAAGHRAHYLCNTRSGRRIQLLPAPRDTQAFAFSADGALLAGGQFGGAVNVWSVPCGELRFTNAALQQIGAAVAFSPDGTLLFSAGQSRILNAATGERLRPLLRLDFSASTVLYSPNGDQIAVAYSDGAVRLWNAHTGALERVFTTPPYRSTVGRNRLIYSPDGTVLTSEAPTAAFRWDVSSGQQLWKRVAEVTVGHRHFQIPCEAVSPDGGTLARAGQARGLIELRSAASGALLHFLTVPEPRGVLALVFSPNGRVLAAGYETYWVRLWDVESGELLQSLAAAADDISAIAFSSNSTTLAAGGNYDPKIDLFDLRLSHSRTRALLGIEEHETSGSDLVDGETEPGSGLRPTFRLAGHVGHVKGIACAPDGHTVATVATDATLKLWEPHTGRLRATLLPLPAPDDTPSEDWIGYTPEGYYHGSPGAEQFLRWSVNGVHFPAELHAATRAGADHLRHALATPREEETNTHGNHVGAD